MMNHVDWDSNTALWWHVFSNMWRLERKKDKKDPGGFYGAGAVWSVKDHPLTTPEHAIWRQRDLGLRAHCLVYMLCVSLASPNLGVLICALTTP